MSCWFSALASLQPWQPSLKQQEQWKHFNSVPLPASHNPTASRGSAAGILATSEAGLPGHGLAVKLNPKNSPAPGGGSELERGGGFLTALANVAATQHFPPSVIPSAGPAVREGEAQDACFSQIRDGLQIYHGHLALLLQVLPAHSSRVDALRLDVSNLSTNIQQQMEDLGLNTVTYPKAEGQGTLPSLSSNFDRQASGFIIPANFKRFLEMSLRALRHLTLV
ncbi:granulocyte colony-stimulating factor isoform X2 [Gopherus evgoodei]|uniref:granulocyte colony-stimulating factor isoform X2 n=1 Tax=Gopherus evgoodei TaxID=1825980 RepID=UPI0011D02FFB|nr:granulocyte colony-stimulating factor isoform X2 [Gopherus evgoodei]